MLLVGAFEGRATNVCNKDQGTNFYELMDGRPSGPRRSETPRRAKRRSRPGLQLAANRLSKGRPSALSERRRMGRYPDAAPPLSDPLVAL